MNEQSADSDADNPPERTESTGGGGSALTSGGVDADVVINSTGWNGPALSLDRLRSLLMATFAYITRPVARVTVTVVGDDRMRALHQTHKSVADTTDVLTFESSTTGGPIEADIVVCADEALRRASELNHSIEQELLLYALHGVLHCAGYDDRTDQDYEAMHAEEDRILTALGVGPIFADDKGPSS